MNVSRRKFLGAGLGVLGVLAMPQIAGSAEMYGLKEFREYAISIYKEAKKYSEKGVVLILPFFEGRIDNKNLELELLGDDDAEGYTLDMKISEPELGDKGLGISKVFYDHKIKGNLLSKEDAVSIFSKDNKTDKNEIWNQDDSYWLQSRLKIKKQSDLEKCLEINPILLSKAQCFDGEAFYDARKKAKPLLKGVYEKVGHSKLQEMGRKEIRDANEEYKTFLEKAIIHLEKEGILKIKK